MQKKTSLTLSIVIPVHNEAENVGRLHQEIVATLAQTTIEAEIIFVDDGSTDDTAGIIKTLHPVKLIVLRKNFGQTSAMDAGIKAAKNDYIITMDGDGQNDPADIPKLIAYLEEHDLDVVSGWRIHRKDAFLKKLTSRGANLLRYVLIHDGIHDSGCTLKVYKRVCFQHIYLYGEMHRFIPAILKIKGFKIGEIPVNHRPRKSGVSKYNWHRTIKGFLDMIGVWFWNKFAMRPLHLLGGSGLMLAFFALLAGLKTIYEYFEGQSLSDTLWPLITIFLAITGFLMIIAGLLADMLAKIYYERTNDAPYAVKEVVENE
jgi:glycosyltransferase involved in cell wall biosynthesis